MGEKNTGMSSPRVTIVIVTIVIVIKLFLWRSEKGNLICNVTSIPKEETQSFLKGSNILTEILNISGMVLLLNDFYKNL